MFGRPAMWVAPETAVGDMLAEALLNGGAPHAWGNYFLGQSIADPGPLFYPVAVLWRSSPPMLLGLLALPLAFWRPRRTKDQRPRTSNSPSEGSGSANSGSPLELERGGAKRRGVFIRPPVPSKIRYP